MNKKRRGNRAMTLVIAFLCAALVFAVVWGVVTVIEKLTHYGNTATIGEETPQQEIVEDPEETAEPEEMEITQKDPEELPKNTLNFDGFYEVDGVRKYHGGDLEGVAGIDVSAYQQEIDWEAVKEAGIEFAMVRVGYRGYSTGELALDEYFHQNMQGAAAAGVELGVYFFSQALNEEEAVEEAEYVLEQIKDYELQYPVVFDWEEMHVQARTDEMNMLLLTACAEAFCQTVEKAGYKAGVYFNQVYGYEQFNLVSLKDYMFWLAEYDEAPSFAYEVQMWQYTNEGTVPGIEGPVDMNIAFRLRED